MRLISSVFRPSGSATVCHHVGKAMSEGTAKDRPCFIGILLGNITGKQHSIEKQNVGKRRNIDRHQTPIS